MFASQLLRILQAIPGDEKNETCVDGRVERGATMMEDQRSVDEFGSFGREMDPPVFGGKEVCKLSGDDHLVFGGGDREDKCWSPKFMVDFSTDDENGIVNYVGKGDENGVLCCGSGLETDVNSLSSGENAEDREHCGIGDLFDAETDLYSDRSAMELDRPELIVCYKDVDRVVKDIWIDEGTPAQEKILATSIKGNECGCFLDEPLYGDNEFEATNELMESDGSVALLLENAKGVGVDEHTSREESNGEILCQEKQKLPLESPVKGPATERCCLEDLTQKGDVVTGALEEDTRLPVQEFGTRSFLRSFLNALDNKEIKSPDLISSRKVVSGGLAGSSEEAGTEGIQSSCLPYNSEVESGSITFNFNSPPMLVEGGAANGRTGYANDTVEVLDHSDSDAENLSDTRQAHCSRGRTINSITTDGQAPDSKDKHRDSTTESVISRVKYDVGESSFSAASFATHSGPIPFSGSLSDGSATSGRSFAFPVLQPEWHSSPARMARADGRHFRKHKCWRSGLLCCRF